MIRLCAERYLTKTKCKNHKVLSSRQGATLYEGL